MNYFGCMHHARFITCTKIFPAKLSLLIKTELEIKSDLCEKLGLLRNFDMGNSFQFVPF